ncbi:MAG: acetyl-CoA hydrolase, partial [Candidatus Saccharibacteria bacterium]
MWSDMYKHKLRMADEAVKIIPDRAGIIAPLANGQPTALINAIAARVKTDDLRDINYISALDVRFMGIHDPEIADKITIEILYAGPISRYFINQGKFTYTPHRFWEGPDIAGQCRDAKYFIMTVAPMDDKGFFSCGLHPDYIWGMARESMPCHIMVEVNEHMPRTYGNNRFHINEIEVIVENNEPLVALPDIQVTEEDKLIGQYIAEQIPDGACIQLGIGGIPNMVAKFLAEKKDLGVHSEMLCDSMVELYKQGVITCKRKNFMPLRWIGSFAV